ncbi:MAG: PAS domain-containing protein [Burkholderiaceae bacterium]|jgi:PAS domain S-box-containing protein|nr:PAS domain-containing protein [Burkholderiaceae bacterium]MEB2317938.1 PAS domain-containing protein [Pseudomonadota bacterium]
MNDADPSNGAIPAEAILAQLPDAVVWSDRAGKILLWNAAAEKLFGFAAAEALGQSLDIMIPERFRRAHWIGFERAVQAGKVSHEGEVRLTRATHKDGRKLYVEVAFGLTLDTDGSVLGVVATARPGEPPERPARA